MLRNKSRLFVLCVLDHHRRLLGVAPWYLENSAARGRILRMLGSGEVCSDYLNILCEPGQEDCVTGALAEWINKSHSDHARETDEDYPLGQAYEPWDLLELSGVDSDDPVISCLVDHLTAWGNTVYSRPASNCWRIELPTSWDAYLGRVSKNRRKQIRRAERTFFRSRRAKLHSVGRLAELSPAMDILITLHQNRWLAQGQPGCFASAQFEAFHREVAEHLFRAGHLQLHWLEVDGLPAAAEYHISGGGVLYAYQSGVNPNLLHLGPGRLITIALLRWAISAGYRAYDFLRGDEPYKASWGAAAHGSLQIHVVPDMATAQLRHGLWLAGASAKQWIKNGLKLVGTHTERK